MGLSVWVLKLRERGFEFRERGGGKGWEEGFGVGGLGIEVPPKHIRRTKASGLINAIANLQ